MQIITAYATQNPCYTQAQRITPKGIVIHSTGANNPHLKRYVDAPAAVGKNTFGNHWNSSNMNVCVHAFIGYDINGKIAVANILPYNFKCWGVGSGKNGSFNTSHIQFEICEDGLTDAAYFNKVWNAAVEYCVFLCEKFGFDPLGENVIVGHCEAYKLGYGSNHADPEHWFKKHGKSMTAFRSAVKAAMGSASNNASSGASTADASKNTLYRVQVGAWRERATAEAMVARLKSMGLEAFIVAQNGNEEVKADTEEKAAAATIKVGSSVKLNQGAKSYTGQNLASFVYDRVHKVSHLKNDRAVITYNSVIVAAVKTSDLTLIE